MTIEPKPNIQSLGAYPLARQGPEPNRRMAHLANNESAHAPSPAVIAAIRNTSEFTPLYPEPTAQLLRDAIGDVYSLPAKQIVCANGSSELISLLAHAYCGVGDEVIIGPHGYLFF